MYYTPMSKTKPMKPTTFREVMNLWPSRAACAKAIGVDKVDTLRKMYVRKSIPVQYFVPIVEAVRDEFGIRLTLEDLHAMREDRFGDHKGGIAA